MNRGAAAILFFILGAACASVTWWTFRQPPPRVEPPRTNSAEIVEAIEAISRRIDAFNARLGPLEGPSTTAVERPAQPDPALAEIQARLTAIEAAVARLGERRSMKPDSSMPAGSQEPPADLPPRIPAPKPKDQRLIDDLLAKGAREPGANGRTYFGLTPREIQQVLGKPDSTKWDTPAGHHDWFYLDAAGATALQVRFEGGVVVGVWP